MVLRVMTIACLTLHFVADEWYSLKHGTVHNAGTPSCN